jgi:nitrite reductase/ring-hydroxylating ferredoxin subunit
MAWVAVATVAQVAAAGMMEAEANGAALLLYNVSGTIYATAAICPHHAAWLSQGAMSGEFVDCPRHQGRFHIPTRTAGAWAGVSAASHLSGASRGRSGSRRGLMRNVESLSGRQ